MQEELTEVKESFTQKDGIILDVIAYINADNNISVCSVNIQKNDNKTSRTSKK